MSVYAAGAICWRLIDGEVYLLVIHRTQHKDITFPKGKVDPGETLPETAVRELKEETGLSLTLGVPLGITEYRMPNGRDKIVHYWAAEVTDAAVHASTFVPNSEVEALEWLPLAKVGPALSYERDQEILERFTALHDEGVTGTFAIIALRHAKAISPFQFDGPDFRRTLLPQGRAQASSIVPTLAAFGPTLVRASTAVRCQETIAPVVAELEIPLKLTAELSQDAFENGEADIRKVVGKRVRKRANAILCSHGPVLPQILREIALATGTTPLNAISRAGDLPVAGFTVVHLSRDRPGSGIIAMETHVPAHV